MEKHAASTVLHEGSGLVGNHDDRPTYPGITSAAAANTSPLFHWDDPNEKTNPKNWSLWVKIFHTLIPCLISFEVTLSSSIMVPAAGLIARKFSVSQTQAFLPLTLFTLGLAFGPLCISPFSEVFGRRKVYIYTLASLLVFTAACSVATTFSMLLAFRFLAGFLGSAGMAIGAGSVADMWVLQTAGGTIGPFFILAPFIGPVIGPIAGSLVVENHNNDWRWTQWLVLAMGVPTLIGAIIMNETSKPWILKHKLESESTDPSTIADVAKQIAAKVKMAIFRSIRMLFTEVVVFSLTIYTAYAYALIFSYFASMPYIFRVYYKFSASQSYMVLLGIAIGYLLGICLFVGFDRTLYARKVKAAGGQLPAPENRLYPALVGSIFLPTGLFWYAWAAREGGNWAVLAASALPFGIGAFSLFLSTINYLVDVYQSAGAASALAANGSLRFLLGAIFPLFTLQMYQTLGVHWAGTIFASLSILLLPVPWLLLRYGDFLRSRSKVVGEIVRR